MHAGITHTHTHIGAQTTMMGYNVLMDKPVSKTILVPRLS